MRFQVQVPGLDTPGDLHSSDGLQGHHRPPRRTAEASHTATAGEVSDSHGRHCLGGAEPAANVCCYMERQQHGSADSGPRLSAFCPPFRFRSAQIPPLLGRVVSAFCCGSLGSLVGFETGGFVES
jgi:hypothetical protein